MLKFWRNILKEKPIYVNEHNDLILPTQGEGKDITVADYQLTDMLTSDSLMLKGGMSFLMQFGLILIFGYICAYIYLFFDIVLDWWRGDGFDWQSFFSPTLFYIFTLFVLFISFIIASVSKFETIIKNHHYKISIDNNTEFDRDLTAADKNFLRQYIMKADQYRRKSSTFINIIFGGISLIFMMIFLFLAGLLPLGIFELEREMLEIGSTAQIWRVIDWIIVVPFVFLFGSLSWRLHQCLFLLWPYYGQRHWYRIGWNTMEPSERTPLMLTREIIIAYRSGLIQLDQEYGHKSFLKAMLFSSNIILRRIYTWSILPLIIVIPLTFQDHKIFETDHLYQKRYENLLREEVIPYTEIKHVALSCRSGVNDGDPYVRLRYYTFLPTGQRLDLFEYLAHDEVYAIHRQLKRANINIRKAQKEDMRGIELYRMYNYRDNCAEKIKEIRPEKDQKILLEIYNL